MSKILGNQALVEYLKSKKQPSLEAYVDWIRKTNKNRLARIHVLFDVQGMVQRAIDSGRVELYKGHNLIEPNQWQSVNIKANWKSMLGIETLGQIGDDRLEVLEGIVLDHINNLIK